jgi:hypothetical protein
MKALPDIYTEIIARIIYDEIIIIYSLPDELLFNNGINLIRSILIIYIKLLIIKYRITIFYYLKTNKKFKNFNNLFNNIFIKILIN